MSFERKRPHVKIISAGIRRASTVLTIMALLCCSKQKSLDPQIVQGKSSQAEVDGLKQQLAQLQAKVSQRDAELEKLQQRPNPAVTTASVTTVPVTATIPSPPADAGAAAQQAIRSVTEQEMVFQLKGCLLSGSLMKCDLLLLNKAGDRTVNLYRNERSRVIDDSGREYPATSFALGAYVGTNSVGTALPGDVPIRGQIQFDGIKPGTKRVQLLEMYCEISGSNGWKGAIIKFDKIDL